MKLSLDFQKTKGLIKPLHGVCNCPIRLGDDKIQEFVDAGIPYVRTHDSGGPYGRNILIDIPNIFRDFDRDPDDPEAYDFAFTDVYIRNLVNSGCKIFYRLGITIENFYAIKAYRTAPPKDAVKWAKICAGVIRHYNYGWANGFHYNIEYWEIWNEPENPPMWAGTQEEFFHLFATTAKYLKQQFPEIKVGGYASCGFYEITRKNVSDFYKNFLRWFNNFLPMVQRESVPLDFFSWHLYTGKPEEIIAHAKYVDKRLKEAGLPHTENIINEWNFFLPAKGISPWDNMKELPSALAIARTFCLMQHSPLDKSMYYDAEPTRGYCGLFYFPSQRVTPVYYAFKAFNSVYQLKNEVRCTGITSRKVTALAAADDDSGAVLLVNYGTKAHEIELNLACPLRKAQVTLLDKEHMFVPARKLLKGKVLTLPERSLLVLTVPFNATQRTDVPKTTVEQKESDINFGGLNG